MHPTVPAPALAPLEQYLELLDHWNARHALTALPKEERFEELILDSCALLPHLADLGPGARLVDFGTGMGVPALVLALARPDLEVHAVDKSKKKIAFVRQAVLELGLTNLVPHAAAAEDLAPIEADAATAKAVGSPALLAGWWGRHGKPCAPLLLLKGEDWATEECPTGWTRTTHPYSLPSRGERVVLRLVREPGP